MFRAVIWQAILDAFTSSNNALTGTLRTVNPDYERGEARRFLTSTMKPWRSDRIFICDCANLEPEDIASICRARLKIAKGKEQSHETARAIKIDKLMEALLLGEDDMTEKAFENALAELSAVEEKSLKYPFSLWARKLKLSRIEINRGFLRVPGEFLLCPQIALIS
jgi:hypothetical protein